MGWAFRGTFAGAPHHPPGISRRTLPKYQHALSTMHPSGEQRSLTGDKAV
jgi:hypothetical protein